jgi:hypothetical protein
VNTYVRGGQHAGGLAAQFAQGVDRRRGAMQEGDIEPSKYWLSTLSEDTPLERMVYRLRGQDAVANRA